MPRSKVVRMKVVGRVTPLLVGLALMMLLLDGCGGASRASQEETAEGRSTSFVRLGLSPTNNSGIVGRATFAKVAAGPRVKLVLRGLPEPHEIYLAHVHPGTCEDEEHPDAPGGEIADRQDNDHRHQEHAHELEENHEATAGEIEYPLTPVEVNAAGRG